MEEGAAVPPVRGWRCPGPALSQSQCGVESWCAEYIRARHHHLARESQADSGEAAWALVVLSQDKV